MDAKFSNAFSLYVVVVHTKELLHIWYTHISFLFQNNPKFGTIIIPILLMGKIRKVKSNLPTSHRY